MSNKENNDEKDTVGGKRKRIMQRFPKYSSVIKNANIVDGGSIPGGRGCTDGTNIWINGGMDESEQIAVLAHEIKHIERGDCGASGIEDWELWNIATDAQINEELAGEGLSVPNGIRIAGAASYGARKLYKMMFDNKYGLKNKENDTAHTVA